LVLAPLNRHWRRFVVGAVAVLFVLPAFVTAQSSRAGVVTAIYGDATRRALYGSPPPETLKLNDPVFLGDILTTKDNARLTALFGGRHALSLRPLSSVLLYEAPGRSQLDLRTGSFDLVIHEPIHARRLLEILTVNASVTVRGSVRVIVEAVPATETAPPITHVDVLEGTTSLQVRRRPGARAEVGANEGITVTSDVVGPVRALR
jgi:hypothetical protein